MAFLFQFLSQETGSDIKLLLERFFRTLYEMRNQSQIRILQKFRFSFSLFETSSYSANQ